MNHEKIPYGKIFTAIDFGRAIRHRRKELKATQALAAGLSGVGQRFLSELERGKPTIELGKALWVAQRLGLDFVIEPRGVRPSRPQGGGHDPE
jgi:HTH-type transcriptional regulator/antitoxin HipB